MSFLFEVSGIRLNVEVNDDAFTRVGVPAFLPSAMVDCPAKHGVKDVDGACFVTSAFMQLPEHFRNIALTHEAGHVAMGHLELEESAGNDLVINERFEAEADKWAADIVGQVAFDSMMDALTHETLKALKGANCGADLTKVKPILDAEIEKRKINYKSI